MRSLNKLHELCVEAGFDFDTYSPEDGVTRYRFYPLPIKPPYGDDYFSCRKEYTALGRKEAESYIAGRRDGALSTQ